MERVLEIIRKDVAADKVRIDNPTQNLESYFLDVVQKARQAAAETSGATSGARVAAYLRGDAEAKPAADKILERLTAPQGRCSRLPCRRPRRRQTRVDEQKLEALAQPAEPMRCRAKRRTSAAKPSQWRSCAKRMKNCRRCWNEDQDP